MPERSQGVVAVVAPSSSSTAALRPLSAPHVRLSGGFWGHRMQLNRERLLPHGFEQLDRAGNLHNLRLAAGATSGRYRALGLMFEEPFPFLDSDVYKWLEGCGWQLGRQPDPDLARSADEVIELVERAQRADGYINSFVQVLAPGREYSDLQWGHELYCIGHLIQAAIAWRRALGDDRLLQVALKAVDSVERALGVDGRQGIDGHPEIEMALVELFRTTAERRHLELAARFIGLRGHGLLGDGRFGRAYWQDHQPVREATAVAGHAVRQLYLDCAVVDVATELGDTQLVQAVLHRWRDMLATRSYLTGGLGSRHKDESFGDPFELPSDVAYAETCAAIASVMLAWRLLLATGDADCADVIERTVYNGVLSGVSLAGTQFFYVNPLQRRTQRAAQEGGHDARTTGSRADWYACACCPPNLMRLFASWEQYLASVDGGGIQIHQYAAMDLQADLASGRLNLQLATDYPWSGEVTVTISEAPAAPWTLSLRIPRWCRAARAHVRGEEPVPLDAEDRHIRLERIWQAGDVVVLNLDMPVRRTFPDLRIDALRGCLALERGPLVYCVETADLPAGTPLEEVVLDADVQATAVPRPDLAPDMVGLTMPASRRIAHTQGWPYGEQTAASSAPLEAIDIGAVPYFAWANRDVAAMRVWIPVAERE